jgi:hypothetical protein
MAKERRWFKPLERLMDSFMKEKGDSRIDIEDEVG